MYDFVIIHGSLGSPFENWFPWLYEKLEKAGKKVLVPQFPCISQNYGDWLKVMRTYDDQIGKKTSFVTHSLGGAFAVNYLLETKKQVKNLYSVAGVYGEIGIPRFDAVNRSFFIHTDFGKAKKYLEKVFCFYSDNDSYVPRALLEDFAKQLDAETEIIKGGDHFSKKAGNYTKFERLLEVVLK